jgi:hypothetical protein
LTIIAEDVSSSVDVPSPDPEADPDPAFDVAINIPSKSKEE